MRLEDVCTVFADGDWIESKDQSEKGIRLVQTGNIGEGIYLEKESRAKYIPEDTFKRLKCTEIFPGDILVSRLPEPVGRACIIPEKTERMITAVDCTICRPDEALISKEYLCYFMRSNAYYMRLLGNVTGTTRKRISRKNLGNVELKVPTKEEQKTVVERLDCLVKVIDSRTKELQLLDDLIKARFVEMFGDLASNPCGWDTFTMEECFDITSSKRILKSEWKSQGIPFLRVRDMVQLATTGQMDNEYFVSEEFYESLSDSDGVPRKGDILVSATSTLGKCHVVGEGERYYFKDADVLRFRAKKEINPIFFMELMKTYYVEDQISKTLGITTVAHFTIKAAKTINMRCPAIELQDEFADFVKQVHKSKVAIQAALDKTQLLFDSLMQKYFG